MARPTKTGLDYFALDVCFTDTDDCIDLLEAEHGLVGFAMLIKLWQKIYANGYYICWNDDAVMLFARKVNETTNKVSSVINSAFRRKIFDRSVYKHYGVLTSRGIQRRYITTCSAAKRKHIIIDSRFLLVADEKILGLITEITDLPSDENTQSKVKQKVVKKSKVNSDDVNALTTSSGNSPKTADEQLLHVTFGKCTQYAFLQLQKLKKEFAYKDIVLALARTQVLGGKTIGYARKLLEECDHRKAL